MEENATQELERLRSEMEFLLGDLRQLRRTLDDSQRLAHLGSWEWDLRTGDVYWSDETYRLHGYDPGELLPQPSTGLGRTHPDDLDAFEQFVERLRAQPGVNHEVNTRLLRPDGTQRPIRTRGTMDVDAAGDPLRFVGTTQDLSAETRSREAEHLLSQIVLSANDAIYTVDPGMRVLSWNPGAERLYGFLAQEMVGRPLTPILPDGEAELSRLISAQWRTMMLAGEVAYREYEATRRRRDGTLLHVTCVIGPLRDGDRNIIGLVASVRDVSSRRRGDQQIAQLVSNDPLTGLYNRRRFEEEVTAAAARARQSGEHAALLLFDLDNFKYVNDIYGHKSGDELVASVATMLSRTVRATDVMARFGGDEFALLLAPASQTYARERAEEMLVSLREHSVSLGEQPIQLSASIGVVTFDGRTSTVPEVIADAEQAMYQSKESGRDRVTMVAPGDSGMPPVRRGVSSEKLIRDALAHDHFELYAQPIVNLTSGQMTHAELLLRLNRDGEVISPGEFLPAAERLGLVHLIDRWVIDRAFEISSKHEDLTMELNLSGATIDDTTLVRHVANRLEHHGTNPQKIVFELTETAAVGNIGKARTLARALADLGCTFAIDDFGAGFSTFYYLKHFPARYVKIDGEFLAEAGNPTDDLVIESIVRIGRGLGKQTIAEFVSDSGRMDRVRRLGVDYGQGYHFAKPFPAGQLADFPRRVFAIDEFTPSRPMLAARPSGR